MRRVQEIAITGLTITFYLCAAAIAWCAFCDTKPPIEIVGGQVVAYDKTSGVMMVEWEALKNRHCPGVRLGWLRDAGPEPPPHAVVALPEVPLPPEGFRGVVAEKGSLLHWRTAIEVPTYLEDTFVYKAEWDFSCNPVQAIFPLRVQSSFIEVSPAKG